MKYISNKSRNLSIKPLSTGEGQAQHLDKLAGLDSLASFNGQKRAII
jgi:hypothetical protein